MVNKYMIYDLTNQKLYPTTVLGEFNNQKMTVSHMLTIIEYYVKFIKQHFDVNQRQYSLTLIALRISRLRLNNQNCRKPTAEQLKCVVDVFKEISDMHAQSEITKQENETKANELKLVIDLIDKIQKERQK